MPYLFQRASLADLVAHHYSRDDPIQKPPSYLRSYEDRFARLRSRPIRLLEVGVQKGRSLLVWRDYFAKGAIDQRGSPTILPLSRATRLTQRL